jgi:hypothetical protein
MRTLFAHEMIGICNARFAYIYTHTKRALTNTLISFNTIMHYHAHLPCIAERGGAY